LDVEEGAYERPAPDSVSLSRIQSEVDRLRGEVEDLLAEQDRLEQEADLLPRLVDTLRHLLPLVSDAMQAEDTAWLGLLIDAGHSRVVEVLQREVEERSGGQAQLASRNIDDENMAVLIATPREYLPGIADLLDEENLSRLRLPPDLEYDSPDSAITTLQERIDRIPGKLSRIEEELQQIGQQWAEDLLLWRDVLMDEIDRREVLNQLAVTDHAFILEGWVPARTVEEIRRALRESATDQLLVEETAIPDDMREEIPVVMDNPKPAQPFEDLVTFLNTPRYEGIDPTVLMALFMPLLFGMILGDAGYGLILLLLSLFMRKKVKEGFFGAIVHMLMYGAGWSIVFGILFGEVFGTLGEHLGLHPVLFHRDDPAHTMDLLFLTVGVGAVHVLLGLVVGIIGSLREKDHGELMEHGGQFIGLVALMLLVGTMTNFLPQAFMTVGIAGLIVGLVILIASMGWTGIAVAPVELVGLIGNILSYLRIAAIGLASVYLAVVANEIAGALGSLVVGGIVAALLHALNIVLGAFSPTIHSLRLHYVEFFGQFYSGGGRPFQPFKARAGSTVHLQE